MEKPNCQLSDPRPTARVCTRWPVGRYLTGSILLVGLALLAASGCGRAFYRRQADCETYGLLGKTEACSHAELVAGGADLNPGRASRLSDPWSPDFPPMPPDDPQSHTRMHCVDGKRGSHRWKKYGFIDRVESPCWESYLPRNDKGEVPVERRTAVGLALLHSRDYQGQLENLYLSALDVTFQRYRFDTQFYGTNSTSFTLDGPERAGDSSSLLETNTDLQATRLFASGAELVVGMANSLVWQFSGPDEYTAFTLLDFSLLQPLLRAGGRAVVLESLTDAERALLANVRQMERFQRAFYAEVLSGRSAGAGPARNGPTLGSLVSAAGGSGALFGLLETQIQIRNQQYNVVGLRNSLNELESAHEAGRIDRFQVDQARQALYNAQSRLLSLETGYEDSLDTYKIDLGLPPHLPVVVDDPWLDRFWLLTPDMESTEDWLESLALDLRSQPDLATDANLARMGQIRGLTMARLDEVVRQRRDLDAQLPGRREGLRHLLARQDKPGQLKVEPSVLSVEALDARVAGFDREYGRASRFLGMALLSIDHFRQAAVEQREGQAAEPSWRRMVKLRTLARWMDKLTGVGLGKTSDVYIRGRIRAALVELMNDLADEPIGVPLDPTIEQNLGRMTNLLVQLSEELTERLAEPPLGSEMALDPEGRFDALLAEMENNPFLVPKVPADEAERQALRHQLGVKLVDTVSQHFSTVPLIMAGMRLEMINLAPVELDPAEALQIARANRRDWQNARAALVDQWRQIELAANELQSGLDLTFSGDINTLGDHPFRFRGTTGRLRVGLEFDAPLTRLVERNAYRETLINYQQARRQYMAFEDSVSRSLRQTLRAIRQRQLEFELSRAGVHVAISQVDSRLLQLREPPKPGAEQKFGATTARDLVSALSGLLSAQNEFLGLWVDHEVDRINLDLDLGTMQLDADGAWIDPGPITAETLRDRVGGWSECLDAPLPGDKFPSPLRPAAGAREASGPPVPQPAPDEPEPPQAELLEPVPLQPVPVEPEIVPPPEPIPLSAFSPDPR